VVAAVGSLVLFVLGPRRQADSPDAAALEPQENVFQA